MPSATEEALTPATAWPRQEDGRLAVAYARSDHPGRGGLAYIHADTRPS